MNRKERRAAQKQGRAAAAPGAMGAAIADQLAVAVQHHQAGRAAEAEGLYRVVLSADPRNIKALQFLGILAHQTGRSDQAIDLMSRAIAANDRVPESHYNLGVVFQAVGRADDAIRHYQRAVDLRPDYAEAQMNLGNAFTDRNRWPEAVRCYQQVIALQPGHAEVHCNLGNALARQGDAEAAILAFRDALKLRPELAEAHNGLGIALLSQGRFDDASVALEQALALKPDLVEARMNLGNVAKAQGRTGDAVEHYRAALALKPDYAEALNNLGNVLALDGRVAEAEHEYRAAIARKPDFAEALNNLGILLLARGQHEEAAQVLREALASRPDFVEAGNNLARTALAAGDANAALDILRHVLTIRETIETKVLIADALKAATTLVDSEELRSLMVRAMTAPWGRVNDLADAGAHLVKQGDLVRDWVSYVGVTWPQRPSSATVFGADRLAAAGRDRLLICLLTAARIGDPELERVLTVARGALLGIAMSNAAVERSSESLLLFAGALARQCFINEYVFPYTEEEGEAVAALGAAVTADLAAGKPVAPLALLVSAAFAPLSTFADSENLLEHPWPEPLKEVLQQQVCEPRAELTIQGEILALTPIGDAVSRLVQAQYEENPYPRWVRAAPPVVRLRIDDYLRRKFPTASFDTRGNSDGIDVLIAGCGTGQHAIETAGQIADARVTAVDLSRASLAYARRKTDELAVSDIEYAQADILGLPDRPHRYDVIEASGVLHHMADPFAGWQALLTILKPGGLMAVGLYSELARADVVATRAFIAERGYRATADDIRRCRQDLFAETIGTPQHAVTQSGDFYTLSGCRDLLFHAQEHRLTIPQIQQFIEANAMRFLGFELGPHHLRNYRARYPDDIGLTNLDNWHQYESENPRTFVGMYQFWVQKSRAAA